jgi:hypothetical protein
MMASGAGSLQFMLLCGCTALGRFDSIQARVRSSPGRRLTTYVGSSVNPVLRAGDDFDRRD